IDAMHAPARNAEGIVELLHAALLLPHSGEFQLHRTMRRIVSRISDHEIETHVGGGAAHAAAGPPGRADIFARAVILAQPQSVLVVADVDAGLAARGPQ